MDKLNNKYLIKINLLYDLVKESINNKSSSDNIYSILQKMRIIHGHLLYKFNKIINSELDDDKLFNISHINSLIILINSKIVESELLFSKSISSNENISSKDLLNLSTQSEGKSKDLPFFDGKKSDDVITRDNIKLELSNLTKKDDKFDINLPTLILFYNPGCPACNKTKPSWDELVNEMKNGFKNAKKLFNIMEFDLSDSSNENLARLFKVEYIPTIILMESSSKQSAKIEKIEGMADKNRIQEFITNSFNKFMK